MPRSGATTFGDLAGRLTHLRLECACGRAGRYLLAKLIEDRGTNCRLTDFKTELTADCPKHRSASIYDQCCARFPDLGSE